MRNGQTPIHIQRWAPADYLADEHVKLLQARRDYLTIAFYRHFIDTSFVAGGDLPADPEMLAAIVSMPKRDVERALAFCVGRLLFPDGDRLYQPRVRREIAEELEFRRSQKDRGEKGAAKRWGSGGHSPAMVSPSSGDSPPAPFASALRLTPAPKRAVRPDDLTADASPTVLVFRAQGKVASWQLTERQVAEWSSLYPGLDVLACCRKALAWSEANPERRKTASGTPKFLVNWLNREANSNGNGNGSGRAHKPATSGTAPSYEISDETRAKLAARHQRAVEESRRNLE